tara:strand:+ start:125 stop:1225 length:1101 start_codon:yes stop_codon:yes gene_type:complete
MSLFERLKNKRYDLQEGKKKIIQKTLFNLSKISNPVKTKVKNPIKKKYSKTSTTGRGFEDITGEGIKSSDIPKTKADLIKKRIEYGINKDGVPSKEGIRRYATKAKQLSSGSNVPVKLTQSDLIRAKKNMVGGTPIKNKAGEVIGTTTGKYGGKLKDLATKVELDATKKAIETSKTINAKPLPKVYDDKASKELTKKFGKEAGEQRNVFKKIVKKLPRKTKVIDTATRRVQLIKPKPLPKTIDPIKTTTFPSSPLRPSNRIYTPSPTELQKLTSTGFKKTTTGAFTKTGKKSFTKLLTKGLSKMGTKGKVAAAILTIGATGYGINKVRTLNKTKKQNTMVPPIGFNQKQPKPMKFGISLGPGQQQK